jgi:6-phosphogluconolactonase
MAVDPTGRFLYVFEENFEAPGGVNIYEYIINNRTGAVTLSPDSPFSAPAGVADAVVDPSGRFLYVAVNLLTDGGSYEIVGFFIDPLTGSLTPLRSSPVPLAAESTGLTVDPSGRFVYVTLEDSTITGYSIDRRSGALRALPGPPLPTGTGPTGIVVGAFIHR